MFYCYNHYVVSWQWHCYQFINLVSSKKKKEKEKFQTTGKLCSFIEKPGINFSFLKKREREREREKVLQKYLQNFHNPHEKLTKAAQGKSEAGFILFFLVN